MNQLFVEHMLLLFAAFCAGGAIGALLKLMLRAQAPAVAADGISGVVYADEYLEEVGDHEYDDFKDDRPESELYAAEELEHEPLAQPRASQREVDEEEHAAEDYEELETEAYGLPAPRGGVADDLTKIRGIGPKIQDTLNELGVFHFDQIASWGEAEVTAINEVLNFPGRIERENWVTQAKEIAGNSS